MIKMIKIFHAERYAMGVTINTFNCRYYMQNGTQKEIMIGKNCKKKSVVNLIS